MAQAVLLKDVEVGGGVSASVKTIVAEAKEQ